MRVNPVLLTAQIVGMVVVFALVLFLAAGTLAWLAGWAFLLLFFGFVTALSSWLLRFNPSLLQERMTGIGKPDQKVWDKVFFGFAVIFFLIWLAMMPLDAIRFHWSNVPSWLQVVGAVLLLGSFYVFFVTFRENAYLSPAVRVQTDRGQSVVSTGPYHVVRHPMYAAFVIFLVGTTLLLGSWFGLIVGLILVIGVAIRAVQEEHTLRAELPGYTAYLAQVKYRLLPFVW
jgi:protein-S-isoprenylcysteine O-methyltransferase Ste14